MPIRRSAIERVLRVRTLAMLILLIIYIILSACTPTQESVDEGETVRIVGSSTVFPFAAKVAEIFADRTGHTVVVEQTGSGGGHKLLCGRSGRGSPDAANSSRPQKASEYELCRRNGIRPIIEIQIGYDGIILARSRESTPLTLTLEQLYLATARDVPVDMNDGIVSFTAPCGFRPNPYQLWSDISEDLPRERIELYGPPPTSGTRDAFVETALERGARRLPCMAALETQDNLEFRRRVQTLREDGRWIDAGENDNSVVQILVNTPGAVGVVGYSFVDQNADIIAAVPIDGTVPGFESIRTGQYPIVRSLFLYLNGANMDANSAIAEYGLEFTSERAAGREGYLDEVGLVPLASDQREDMRRRIRERRDYRTGQEDVRVP